MDRQCSDWWLAAASYVPWSSTAYTQIARANNISNTRGNFVIKLLSFKSTGHSDIAEICCSFIVCKVSIHFQMNWLIMWNYTIESLMPVIMTIGSRIWSLICRWFLCYILYFTKEVTLMFCIEFLTQTFSPFLHTQPQGTLILGYWLCIFFCGTCEVIPQ